jgi:FMN reductase
VSTIAVVGNPEPRSRTRSVAEVAVLAGPTYQAITTGLLTLFLDQVGTGDLAGVVAVPLMLGGGPGHALAPELLLEPVLVVLGATAPTGGLDDWLVAAGPQVAAARTAGPG